MHQSIQAASGAVGQPTASQVRRHKADLLDRLVRGEGDAQDGPQHFPKLDDLADRAADDVHWDSKADPAVGP